MTSKAAWCRPQSISFTFVLEFRIPGTSTFCNSAWKSSKQTKIVIDKNFEFLPHSVPEEKIILQDGPQVALFSQGEIFLQILHHFFPDHIDLAIFKRLISPQLLGGSGQNFIHGLEGSLEANLRLRLKTTFKKNYNNGR